MFCWFAGDGVREQRRPAALLRNGMNVQMSAGKEPGQSVEGELERLKVCSPTPGSWDALPAELHNPILVKLVFEELFRLSLVSKYFLSVPQQDSFRRLRAEVCPAEGHFSPLVFFVEKGQWNILGFDSLSGKWRRLPPLRSPIPIPEPELFKDFLVAGHVGLFCMNVGKASESEKLLVTNPLAGEVYPLPDLIHPRHPVALSLHVTKTKKTICDSTFRVIAVGSAAVGSEHRSRKTEVYCSSKGNWEVLEDVPGTYFSVNDYQTGVYCENQNVLLLTGFMVNGSKGILALDVAKGKWRQNWICPYLHVPPDGNPDATIHFAIAQLVKCDDVIYLFTEQEAIGKVTHCIDRLDLEKEGGFTWTRKLVRQRQGNRALLVYPEFTCVPIKENKLCIYNTIERTGVVYEMVEGLIDPSNYESLPKPPPMHDVVRFQSLNPVGYAFEPSFGVSFPELKKSPKPKILGDSNQASPSGSSKVASHDIHLS
nr:uncharacterized protein LOC112278766 isoform X2 [Physcomitrium patens]|eukprot:XP_024368272.1 uncharacterized protein LOC112278766 isoform X2 [Physcomitrella patens]